MIFKENANYAETKESSLVRIGIFGVGYEKYWAQFPGLFEELMQKQEKFISKFHDSGIMLIDFGMVDSPVKAYEAVKKNEKCESRHDFL